MGTRQKRPAIAEIGKDANGEWRWKVKGGNGEHMSALDEGLKNRQDCIANADGTCHALADLLGYKLVKISPDE